MAGPTISRRDSSGTGLANADRLAPAARHKVAWFVEIRSALAAGTVGLASVTAAIDGSIGGISESLGQWKIWPLAGAAAADPYTRAHFTAEDRLPPNSFEVQEYETSVDSEGRSLDASCTYRLSGRMPPTRWWSVWAMVPGASADQQPGGVTSNDVVYDANGEVMIALSASPQTGQWVHLTDSATSP